MTAHLNLVCKSSAPGMGTALTRVRTPLFASAFLDTAVNGVKRMSDRELVTSEPALGMGRAGRPTTAVPRAAAATLDTKGVIVSSLLLAIPTIQATGPTVMGARPELRLIASRSITSSPAIVLELASPATTVALE